MSEPGYNEIYEKMNYSVVINQQLNRVIEARSRAVPPNKLNAAAYIMALEAFYTSILPSLRRGLDSHMVETRRAFDLAVEVEDLLKLNPRAGGTTRFRELADELEGIARRVLGDREVFAYNYYHLAMLVADAFLEKILDKLNRAGLLLHGRVIHSGFPGGGEP